MKYQIEQITLTLSKKECFDIFDALDTLKTYSNNNEWVSILSNKNFNNFYTTMKSIYHSNKGESIVTEIIEE